MLAKLSCYKKLLCFSTTTTLCTTWSLIPSLCIWRCYISTGHTRVTDWRIRNLNTSRRAQTWSNSVLNAISHWLSFHYCHHSLTGTRVYMMRIITNGHIITYTSIWFDTLTSTSNVCISHCKPSPSSVPTLGTVLPKSLWTNSFTYVPVINRNKDSHIPFSEYSKFPIDFIEVHTREDKSQIQIDAQLKPGAQKTMQTKRFDLFCNALLIFWSSSCFFCNKGCSQEKMTNYRAC